MASVPAKRVEHANRSHLEGTVKIEAVGMVSDHIIPELKDSLDGQCTHRHAMQELAHLLEGFQILLSLV